MVISHPNFLHTSMGGIQESIYKLCGLTGMIKFISNNKHQSLASSHILSQSQNTLVSPHLEHLCHSASPILHLLIPLASLAILLLFQLTP